MITSSPKPATASCLYRIFFSISDSITRTVGAGIRLRNFRLGYESLRFFVVLFFFLAFSFRKPPARHGAGRPAASSSTWQRPIVHFFGAAPSFLSFTFGPRCGGRKPKAWKSKKNKRKENRTKQKANRWKKKTPAAKGTRTKCLTSAFPSGLPNFFLFRSSFPTSFRRRFRRKRRRCPRRRGHYHTSENKNKGLFSLWWPCILRQCFYFRIHGILL